MGWRIVALLAAALLVAEDLSADDSAVRQTSVAVSDLNELLPPPQSMQDTDIIETAQFYCRFSYICLTQYGACRIRTPELPGTYCYCPSLYGPVYGIVVCP
jgi:hypothetical protein